MLYLQIPHLAHHHSHLRCIMIYEGVLIVLLHFFKGLPNSIVFWSVYLLLNVEFEVRESYNTVEPEFVKVGGKFTLVICDGTQCATYMPWLCSIPQIWFTIQSIKTDTNNSSSASRTSMSIICRGLIFCSRACLLYIFNSFFNSLWLFLYCFLKVRMRLKLERTSVLDNIISTCAQSADLI